MLLAGRLSLGKHGRAQEWGPGFQLTLEDVPGMRCVGTGDWAGLGNCYFWIVRAAGRTHHHANHDLAVAGDPLPVRLRKARVGAGSLAAAQSAPVSGPR